MNVPDSLTHALAGLAEPAPPTLAGRVAAALAQADRFVTVPGPSGPLWVAFSDAGISLVYMAPDEATFRAAFDARWPGQERPLVPATAPPKGLLASLEGRRPARALRYDLSGYSSFQREVLAKTAEIPRGEVRSYGWVAREIGQDTAVRAVGTALGRNPVPVLIPCHRVVRTDGHIGNYGFGTPVKVRLLTDEGVDLEELARLAAARMRYVGSATTHIICLPTCHAARRIRAANRVMFRSGDDATAAGYRPCQKCRPVPALVA